MDQKSHPSQLKHGLDNKIQGVKRGKFGLDFYIVHFLPTAKK
jgi:hypothetical protein